jgi:hypothetical protein
MSFLANGQSGLLINDASGGGITFADAAAGISGDTILNFGLTSSVIDLTNVVSGSVNLKFNENASGTAVGVGWQPYRHHHAAGRLCAVRLPDHHGCRWHWNGHFLPLKGTSHY